MSKYQFEQGKDYYLEDGRIIFTKQYLVRRGTCCGSGCRHCPFDPHHQKGIKNLREKGKDED